MIELVLNILLAIGLILLDRFLTVVSFREYRKMDDPSKIQFFELNPKIREKVEKGIFWDRQEIVYLFLVAFFFWFSWIWRPYFLDIMSGMVIIPFLLINLNHLRNLVAVKFVAPHAKGKIEHPKKSLYLTTIFSNFCTLAFLVFLFMITQSRIILGGIIGLASQIFHLWRWSKK